MIYEINFLVLQSQTENLPTIREKIKKMLEKIPAKITDQLEYQKRKLAYTIEHQNYGFFTVFRFEINPEENPESLEELKKTLNLESDVARYLIIRADELPPLKSVKKEAVETIDESEEKSSTRKPIEKKKEESHNKKEEDTLANKVTKPEKETEKISTQQIKKEDLVKELSKKEEKSKKSEEKGDEDDSNASLDALDEKLDEILGN